MLEKINKLTNWQAAIIIAVIGFAVFFTGLNNPFQGDDAFQIVNNPTVHSIKNIKLFFEGGTFYNGQGAGPLQGAYYRPLMTTAFSILYTVFGSKPLYFHLLQLMIGIGSAIILYLFFRYSFKPALALFLALIFLVHPLDSQVIFAIPTLQDALFFFFGILGLYILVRFDSIKWLVLAALCLFLSLLSKESGILFLVIDIFYIFWWKRKRLIPFICISALPVIVWLVLKANAVGLSTTAHIAPIDNLGLSERLFMAPSVFLFYVGKFLFPVKLASGYYWLHPTFSVNHFLVALVIDVAIVAAVIYLGFIIRNKSPKAQFYTYVFFAVWWLLGIAIHMQIIPLDFTAAEPWFYFSMAGLLGMLGIAYTVFAPKFKVTWPLVIAGVLIVGLLGFRTAVRGLDWRSETSLGYKDIAASPDDFNAYTNIAKVLINQGKYDDAKPYITRSVNIYPTFTNELDLGAVLSYQGDYAGATAAFKQALKYSNYNYIGVYEDIGALTLVYGDFNTDRQFLVQALTKYPQDSSLWQSLALLEAKNNYAANAKTAISNAVYYGQVSPVIYQNILSGQPFVLNFGNTGRTVSIP